MAYPPHLIAYLVGITIVILSHLFLLGDPAMQMHALLNLVAAGLIAYYFVKTSAGRGLMNHVM